MGTSANPPSPLKQARLNLGLRQEDVAGRADISTSYLSMLERGLFCPNDLRHRLSKALDSPVDVLFPPIKKRPR